MGTLKICTGNILNFVEGKDLIVNSANKHMALGSGVCGAIYKAAGIIPLTQYCKDHFQTLMKVNEIRITPGFALGLDILHIFCPKRFESKAPEEELLRSYDRLFAAADNNRYKDVISVSLGTGAHGYQHTEYIKVGSTPAYRPDGNL